MRHNHWKAWKVISVALLLTGCASEGVVDVGYEPQKTQGTALAAVSPTKVKCAHFTDVRPQGVESILIGERFGLGKQPLGEVTSVRPVFDVVREAIQKMLSTAGDKVVEQGEDVVLSGEIRQFWVGTPKVTALYWLIVGNVELLVELKSAKTGKRIFTHTYAAEASRKTYSRLSDERMKGVIEQALGEVMQAISSDEAFAHALSAASSKAS